jgi:hypothetical protein
LSGPMDVKNIELCSLTASTKATAGSSA